MITYNVYRLTINGWSLFRFRISEEELQTLNTTEKIKIEKITTEIIREDQ